MNVLRRSRSLACQLCTVAVLPLLPLMTAGARADTQTHANTTPLIIIDGAPANPYPSDIVVAGQTGVISHVSVTLHGVSHTFPADLDVLLVAPSGKNIMLMSDAGQGFDLVDVTFTIDDLAPSPLPQNTAIAAGTYQPADYPNDFSGTDVFPAPAPSPSAATSLATFAGDEATGTWSLYVRDDFLSDDGAISGGWSLTITTNSTTTECFSAQAYPVGVEPSCVVMADLNADGFNDLAVANHGATLDNRISILMNNGDGTFAPSVYYDTGDRPYWIAHGDMDGDTDIDLAVTNFFDTTVSVFLNDGTGSFAPQVTYTIGNGPGFVALAKLDAGNVLDLAATNISDGTVSVLIGNGDGTFQPQTVYACGVGPYGLTAAYLDADSVLDLAVSNHHTDTVSILIGAGDGSFGPPTAYTVHAGPVGNDVRDFDGDGDRDLVVANTNQAATGTTVSVLLNNGDGTFAPQAVYPAAIGPYTVRAIDFDGDGDIDFACSHESGFASVYLNNGDGTFAPAANFHVGQDPVGLDAGDLDGNGTPELAITCYNSQETWVLFNESAGITQQPASQILVVGDNATFVVVANGPGPFTYQWRRDGLDLVDGGNISGAQTDTLSINSVTLLDQGDIDVIVSNGCGSLRSEIATLTVVTPTCAADCAPAPTGDGVVNVTDLLAVIGAWGACASCPADINDDGLVNVTDLLAVIGAWGPCP